MRSLRRSIFSAKRGATPAHPFALPQREISVLDGERRQCGFAPLAEGGVEVAELAKEDTHRPAVGDDVVHADDEDVVVVVAPDEFRAQEGTGLEVEGAGILFGRALLRARLALNRREVPEVLPAYHEIELGGDLLRWLSARFDEAGAQHLVARHDGIQGTSKTGSPSPASK